MLLWEEGSLNRSDGLPLIMSEANLFWLSCRVTPSCCESAFILHGISFRFLKLTVLPCAGSRLKAWVYKPARAARFD